MQTYQILFSIASSPATSSLACVYIHLFTVNHNNRLKRLMKLLRNWLRNFMTEMPLVHTFQCFLAIFFCFYFMCVLCGRLFI